MLHVVPRRHRSILNCDSPQSTLRTGNTEVEWQAVNWYSFYLSLDVYYYIFYSYNKTWSVYVFYFAECTQTEQRVAESDACARALRLTEGMCAGKQGKFRCCQLNFTSTSKSLLCLFFHVNMYECVCTDRCLDDGSMWGYICALTEWCVVVDGCLDGSYGFVYGCIRGWKDEWMECCVLQFVTWHVVGPNLYLRTPN